MKVLLVCVLAALAVCALADADIDNCKCWDGYEAKKNTDGKVECHGTRVFALKPCNLPEPPKCVCTEKVTGILTDKEGTWCSVREKGEEVKRWPCENKDEWAAHKILYEEFEKNYKP